MMRICTTIAFLLFRMKTVIDLRRLINDYKKDVSEHGSFLASEKWFSVVHQLQPKKYAKPMEKAKIVAKLAPGQDVNSNALCTSIKRVLQTINDMKKHLTRTWEDIYIYFYLNSTLAQMRTSKFKDHFSEYNFASTGINPLTRTFYWERA